MVSYYFTLDTQDVFFISTPNSPVYTWLFWIRGDCFQIKGSGVVQVNPLRNEIIAVIGLTNNIIIRITA